MAIGSMHKVLWIRCLRSMLLHTSLLPLPFASLYMWQLNLCTAGKVKSRILLLHKGKLVFIYNNQFNNKPNCIGTLLKFSLLFHVKCCTSYFSGLVYLKELKGHQFLLCQTREHQNKQTASRTWERKCSTCFVTLVHISPMIPFYLQKWCALEKHLWKRLVWQNSLSNTSSADVKKCSILSNCVYIQILKHKKNSLTKDKFGECYFNSWSFLWSINITNIFMNNLRHSWFITRNI